MLRSAFINLTVPEPNLGYFDSKLKNIYTRGWKVRTNGALTRISRHSRHSRERRRIRNIEEVASVVDRSAQEPEQGDK